MTPRARISLAALVVVLATLGLFSGTDPRALGPGSFGTSGHAYGALYDVLAESGLPVSRSYAAPEALPADATVWWIRPRGLCEKLAGAREGAAARPAWQLEDFVRRGGTAVLWLPGDPLRCLLDARIGGHPLPVRWSEQRLPGADARAASPGAEGSAEALPLAQDPAQGPFGGVGDPSALRTQWVSGDLSPRARALVDRPLASFSEAPGTPGTLGWRVRARLDGSPFVVERPLGAGRVVVIADAGFARNAVLDRGDAAPFAYDLALAHGAPRFDEREHGLRDTPGTTAYLLRSPAAPALGGLAVLFVVLLWAGRALPPRSLDDAPLEAPTIERFVDSLAALQARSDDRGRILERYRELSLRRLRRLLHLPDDLPRDSLLALLRAHPAMGEAGLRLFTDPEPHPSEARLRAVAGRLDACVEAVAADARRRAAGARSRIAGTLAGAAGRTNEEDA